MRIWFVVVVIGFTVSDVPFCVLIPAETVASVVPSNVSALPLVAALEPLRYKTPLALPPDRVTVLEALSVVKAPVEGVVAPIDDELMVLLVSVCVSVVPTIAPDGCVPTITVPVDAGSVSVFVPATAVGLRVIWPEVAPLSVKLPISNHRPS